MRTGRDLLSRCFEGFAARQRVSERASWFSLLDLALVDAPSLCCDGDEFCAACAAETAPILTTAYPAGQPGLLRCAP